MNNDFFDQSENSMPRIGDQAPAFRSVTEQGTIYFPADYFGKWVILFSNPSDFAPVATSAFKTLASIHDNFKSFNCELLGLSIDEHSRHTPCLCAIKEKIEYKGAKNIEIKFPVIEDITMEVARKYGIIQSDKNNSTAVCAVFIIDPECMIRAIIYYSQSLGLNFDELKRVIVALQKEDEPILPHVKSYELAQERMEPRKEGKNCYERFFCTRELSEIKLMNVN